MAAKESRPIDALLCYRLALREVEGGVDARFHLGEIAWHLGNAGDAIAAWEGAVERSTDHLPSLHALADAYAATGQFDAAALAAGRVLALSPQEPRANALVLLLRAARGEGMDSQALYRDIGRFFAQHGLWPTPQNYALVYQVLVDGQSPAAQAVKAATSDGVRTPSRAATPPARFLGPCMQHESSCTTPSAFGSPP